MDWKGGKKVLLRWMRFNSVGVIGAVIHLSSLAVLAHGLGMNYLPATALAIEAAVLHNFIWHQNWTWKDRPVATLREVGKRLVTFHMSNGLTSVVGNLLIMKLLVGYLHMPVLPASGTAILICALVNFLLSDRIVFRNELGKIPDRVTD